jgi:hypothetical protein
MQLKVTALSRQNDALRRQLRSLRQGEGVEMANTDELREYAVHTLMDRCVFCSVFPRIVNRNGSITRLRSDSCNRGTVRVSTASAATQLHRHSVNHHTVDTVTNAPRFQDRATCKDKQVLLARS